MHTLSKLITICGLSVALPAMAGMYKWVDENGHTQYSQDPPPGQKTEEVKPPPKVDTESAVRELREEQKQFDTRIGEKNKKGEDAGKTEIDAQKKKEACETARKNLVQLQNAYRVYEKDKDGNRVKITEEERVKKTAGTQEQIKKFCT